MYFFRLFFGVRGFTYGSLLFLSFVFVCGASVLRTDSWLSFLFLFVLPSAFLFCCFALRYRNAVCLLIFRLEP